MVRLRRALELLHLLFSFWRNTEYAVEMDFEAELLHLLEIVEVEFPRQRHGSNLPIIE